MTEQNENELVIQIPVVKPACIENKLQSYYRWLVILSLFGGLIPYIGGFVFILFAIYVFCVSIGQFVKIRKSCGRLYDNGFVLPSLAATSLVVISLLFIAGGVIYSSMLKSKGQSKANDNRPYEVRVLRGIENNLKRYMHDNDGKFPPSELWCDALGKYDSYYVKGELGYFAVNEQAIDYVNGENEAMVLMFPAVKGWNMVGGKSLLRDDNGENVYYLDTNLNIRDCPYEKASFLKWSQTDSGVIPRGDIIMPISVLSSCIIIPVFVLCFKQRDILVKCFCRCLLFVFISAFIGAFFGMIAENLFYTMEMWKVRVRESLNAGLIVGGLLGLISGVLYFVYMTDLVSKLRKDVHAFGYANICGVITGMVSGILLHVFLPILYEGVGYQGIFLGLFFGMWGGSFASCISVYLIPGYNLHNANLEIAKKSAVNANLEKGNVE